MQSTVALSRAIRRWPTSRLMTRYLSLDLRTKVISNLMRCRTVYWPILVFPWCGYLINMSDLSVTIDYGRFHDNCTYFAYYRFWLTLAQFYFFRSSGFSYCRDWPSCRDCFYPETNAVSWSFRVWPCTDDRMCYRLAKSKSHIIFNDCVLNPRSVVLKNIYENFLLCAMKMHHYLQSWGLEIPKSSKFILSTSSHQAEVSTLLIDSRTDTIRQVIRYTHTTILSKSNNQIAKAANARVDVTKPQVIL